MPRIGYDIKQFYRERDKLKNPDGVHCIICGNVFEKPDKRRSYCSNQCYNDWYNSLNINSWTRIRDEVIKRDGKCMECGITEEDFVYDVEKPRNGFEVHHIIPIVDGGNEFDIGNCITLCVDCHIKKHNSVGKKIELNNTLDAYV